MERLAVGLYDGMNLGLAGLSYRAGAVSGRWSGRDWRCLPAGGRSRGIRCMPVTAAAYPRRPVPAQALACELYKVAGIRAVEIGSFLLGRDPKR
ncbi:hypothetical protein MWG47_01220 [Escherichia coli]|nr:hypothetical protein [Escherichia coli]